MDDGALFTSAQMTVRRRGFALPQCDSCGLFRGCQSPKMPVTGDGRRRVLLVSEYPGPTEDARGYQFAGGTGDYLESELSRVGVNMRRDCWLTNASICYGKTRPDKVVDFCRPNLLDTIRRLKPDAVLLLGGDAVQSLVGHAWKESVGAVGRWAGYVIPSAEFGCWLCPTYNPAFLTRQKDQALEQRFRRHLKTAFALDGPPPPPVDYARRVEVLMSPAEAAGRLDRYRGGMIAFDFETTTLKPDGPHARVVCCSVCWNGEETIAYPWMGPAVGATVELLEDPDVGKVGSNTKFEHRWCLRKLGVTVRNWKWCTMLAAHALDPRGDISSIKFQAFVRLGMPRYNDLIEPFLESEKAGGNEPNRVGEVKPSKLLEYCGLDSLLEYEVARLQMTELGVTS